LAVKKIDTYIAKQCSQVEFPYYFVMGAHFAPTAQATLMDMKRQISMFLFMSMLFILIKMKFDIDINNDELLTTIWEHCKKESLSNVEPECQ
jgi:hypothetical protein